MSNIHLSQNARRVLEARYLRRDANRTIVETPDHLFERVAAGVVQAESMLGNPAGLPYWQEQFHKLLATQAFLPNSPTLMNAPGGQLSACFVLPVDDTMEDIFEAVKQMALVQRTGGGTGFSFSRLRPKGDIVHSTGGEASGPVSFMKIFDATTEYIKQGGKRRGANMGILRVDHPDILEFITAKLDGSSLQNFNISVGATDTFMEAVRRGQPYDLINPRTGKAVGALSARHVWDTMVDAAWRTGDPGMFFLDAANRANPTPHLGPFEATNPCGEIPLLPYESCNLGSINLARVIVERGGSYTVDYEALLTLVRTAVRFLDDIIEVNRFPIPQIDQMTRGNRKIGLGVMGFADLLIRLGVSYDSDDAIRIAEQVMEVIAEEARATSYELAEARGSFPNWKGSVYETQGLPMRNATQTAIAPTGTISIIAGTSAGIEPVFALAYRRSHVLSGQTLYESNPLFLEHLQRTGQDAEAILARISETGGLKGSRDVPDETKRLFVTALEIPVERHLQIQAAFQRHVDNSVSKTINLPQDAEPREIGYAYWRAWELGLKDVTVFRYGSKGTQVLELGAGEESYHYDHASKCDPSECRVEGKCQF